MSCCSVIQCRVRESLLTFVVYFFKRTSISETTKYPDGTIRKNKRHLQGHVYLSNRGSLKKRCHDAASARLNISTDEESEEQINAPENVQLESISYDEWSSDNE